jgi:outer membrane murein-binding lipoprotein Lpp
MRHSKSNAPRAAGLASRMIVIVGSVILAGCNSSSSIPDRFAGDVEKAQAAAEEQRVARAAALERQVEARRTPADPLAVPDFLGEAEFPLTTDVESLIQQVRREAEDAQSAIEEHRAEVAKQNPVRGLLVPVYVKATTQQQFDDQYFEYRLQELATVSTRPTPARARPRVSDSCRLIWKEPLGGATLRLQSRSLSGAVPH